MPATRSGMPPERAEKQRRHSRTAGRARMMARLAPGLSQTRNV